MIPAVFAATFRVLGRPGFQIPALLVAVAADVAIRVNGWPTADLRDWPVPRQFSIAIIVLLARGWFDLTLIAVGIAVVRGQPAGILRQWVHVLRALQIAAVSLLLLIGVLLGTLVVVIPGVYLLLRWSQVLPAMIERRTRVRDVFMYSEAIASAHYLRILVIWFLAWGVPALLAYGAGRFDHWRPAEILWSAVLHAFGLALIAGLYVELDTRAYVRDPIPVGSYGQTRDSRV
jgi:hypothetical protein